MRVSCEFECDNTQQCDHQKVIEECIGILEKTPPRKKKLRRKIWTGSWTKLIPSRELTYLVLKALLKMISLFPQVGYVSSLEVSQPQPLQKEIYPALVRELKFGTVPMVSSEKASNESLLIHKRKIQRLQDFTPKIIDSPYKLPPLYETSLEISLENNFWKTLKTSKILRFLPEVKDLGKEATIATPESTCCTLAKCLIFSTPKMDREIPWISTQTREFC